MIINGIPNPIRPVTDKEWEGFKEFIKNNGITKQNLKKNGLLLKGGNLYEIKRKNKKGL